MVDPFYPIPKLVPTTNFLNRNFTVIREHELPFGNASKGRLLPHEPLWVFVHLVLGHPVDDRSHALVAVHALPVFLQGVLLPREPADDAGFDGGVIGVEEAHLAFRASIIRRTLSTRCRYGPTRIGAP